MQRAYFPALPRNVLPLYKEEAHGTSEEKVERAYPFDRSPEAGGT